MFGYIVLYSWPVVVIILFSAFSRPVALLSAIIVGYLLLPTQISLDLPALPSLNKDTIPAIAAFLIIALMPAAKNPPLLQGWMPRGALPKVLILATIVGAFLTVMTNGDPLVYDWVVLPGLRPWDAFSTVLTTLILLLPFLLGRRLLSHPDQQRLVLIAMAATGAFYSLLALYEVRMSPQLNSMIYGFFPHAWDQHVRGDGFRPLVFLSHGLWLAMFFSAAILSAFGLTRLLAMRHRALLLLVGFWLLMTLVLSKSLGALIITLMLIPAVILLKQRGQLMIAAALATIVLIYPMLRGADLIPVDRVLEWAENINPDRASSLGFRLANEDVLLDKAQQRPLFGWGGWARNLVFDEAGQTTSVTDGYWVLIIGQGGWVRYLGEFGLLCFPIILAALRTKRYGLGLETSVLSLILAGNLVDLIPNATITPLTWMIAGAFWGRLELGVNAGVEEVPERVPDDAGNLLWARTPQRSANPRDLGQEASGEKAARRQRYTRQITRIRRTARGPGGTGR